MHSLCLVSRTALILSSSPGLQIPGHGILFVGTVLLEIQGTLIVAGRNEVVRPAGFEPATLCLEGRCSIHLSYGRAMMRMEPLRLSPAPDGSRV